VLLCHFILNNSSQMNDNLSCDFPDGTLEDEVTLEEIDNLKKFLCTI